MAPNPPTAVRRPAAERILAWLYTGPLGHLYATVVDIALLAGRYWAGRIRARARSMLGRAAAPRPR